MSHSGNINAASARTKRSSTCEKIKKNWNANNKKMQTKTLPAPGHRETAPVKKINKRWGKNKNEKKTKAPPAPGQRAAAPVKTFVENGPN
jgi:hypothetical protein